MRATWPRARPLPLKSSVSPRREPCPSCCRCATIGGSPFWTQPYGEPEWVTIPRGAFSMGEGGIAHQVHLDEYAISRVPISNAQYAFFVQATGREQPREWTSQRPPRAKEGHPVVRVTWHDALAYCRWLSEATGKPVTLPSEAEWEKAARGADDARAYPWGDVFDAARCNVGESMFWDKTPVGMFLQGASPYGCLDMAGNVWEWTRSLLGEDIIHPRFAYPYDPADPMRERLDAANDIRRIVRGGSAYDGRDYARCAYRDWLQPDLRSNDLGFRIVLRSAPVSSALYSVDSEL